MAGYSPFPVFLLRRASFAQVVGLLGLLVFSAGCEQRERPNLLLVTLDTTRADRLGCYGYESASTTALDGLSEHGVRFERAYAQVPLTLPSHVSLMTGAYPAVHGVRVNAQGRVPRGLPTLAEALGRAGYATGAFVSAFVLDAAFGLDRGFAHYDDRMGDERPSAAFRAERRADLTTDAALAWLETQGDRPFFAWLHYYDPHTPYEPPEGFRSPTDSPYDGEIAFVDTQLGRVLAWLESTGRRERTLVVVLGDHGESLGEHGEPEHGLFVYDATMRVPLLISWPGRIPEGLVVPQPVQAVDVLPTILELCGVESTAPVDGRSLVPAFDDELEPLPAIGESLYGEIGYGWAPLRFVVDGDAKYVEAPERELYDLRDDPGEKRNLAAVLPGRAARLDERLHELTEDLEPYQAEAVTLDRDARAMLDSLGYLGGSSRGSVEEDGERPDPKSMVGVLREHTRANALIGAGRYAEAATLLERLVQLSPGSFDLYEDLGWAYLGMGRNADAERAYATSLHNLPLHAERLWGLAESLRRQHKCRQAIEVYDRALVQRPEMGETHMGLALCYSELGQAEQALAQAERHAEINPASPVAWTNLALLAAETGRVDRAFEAVDRLLALAPDDRKAHVTRWTVLDNAGAREAEIAALRESLERFPDDWLFVSLLGWRLAVSSDGTPGAIDEALALGRRAVALAPERPRSHDVLAAALAASADYEAAIEAADRAIELAEASGMTEMVRAIRSRRELYVSGRPYRE